MKILASRSRSNPNYDSELEAAIHALLSEAASEGGYAGYQLISIEPKIRWDTSSPYRYPAVRHVEHYLSVKFSFDGGVSNKGDKVIEVILDTPPKDEHIPKTYYSHPTQSWHQAYIGTILDMVFPENDVMSARAWFDDMFKKFSQIAKRLASKYRMTISEPKMYTNALRATFDFHVTSVDSKYDSIFNGVDDLYLTDGVNESMVWPTSYYNRNIAYGMNSADFNKFFESDISNFLDDVTNSVKDAEADLDKVSTH